MWVHCITSLSAAQDISIFLTLNMNFSYKATTTVFDENTFVWTSVFIWCHSNFMHTPRIMSRYARLNNYGPCALDIGLDLWYRKSVHRSNYIYTNYEIFFILHCRLTINYTSAKPYMEKMQTHGHHVSSKCRHFVSTASSFKSLLSNLKYTDQSVTIYVPIVINKLFHVCAKHNFN